jgi:3-oxoacyl-[acyl-carrier-protein] synthase-3
MPGITVIGTGMFAPGEPVTNHALSRVMDTNDEWIRQRTGIVQRHFVTEGQTVSDLGYEAAKRAIADAGVEASEIDYIVMATMTPDYAFPGPGGMVGEKLGIAGIPALDIRQQCCAVPFGLQVADGLVSSGAASTVLFVGADAHAGFMPWSDWDVLRGESDREVSEEAFARATRHRGVSILFGDGAGAMVLRKSEDDDGGLLGSEIHTDGGLAELIHLQGGGFRGLPYCTPGMLEREEYIPRMDGRNLFKAAVTKLPKVVKSLVAKHGLTVDDIDLFVAHQANDRINSLVRQNLGAPEEKVPSNIAVYGNTSAGTIGILLDEQRRTGRVKRGDLVCFLALGAGLNWGAVLMRL